jgi:23S rRNA (guanosine2251-2'-O)-methyltransferase
MKPTNLARPNSGLVAGRIPVLECLRAKKRKARRLLYLPTADDIREILDAASTIPCERRDRQQLDRLTEGVPHQGVVLEADPLATLSVDEWLHRIRERTNVCALLLDGVEDPHNFGAVIRSAAAFGSAGVLFGKDRSAPLSMSAMKSAAGAAEYIDLVQITNIPRALAQLKDAGFWISGLDAEGDRSIWNADLRGRCVLVVGSEGRGIRRIVRESCDFLLNIPIEGPITSLNASVSAAVTLAEWKRQTSTPAPEAK